MARPAPAELRIVWQRLVTDGETCPRCGSTGAAAAEATRTLTEVLRPLGIVPALEARVLDQRRFDADPAASNRIWIDGRPLEDWVGASVGSSECCSVCGDSPCRTLEVDGSTVEAVPAELIVRAGLVAAASMLGR